MKKEHSLQQQLTILASHSGFSIREIHDIYNENKEKFKSIDDQKMFDEWVDIYANTEPNDKGFQKQYKRRAEDMAKAYGYKLTDEQKKKFKI
mgnify:CR=1 FL=1